MREGLDACAGDLLEASEPAHRRGRLVDDVLLELRSVLNAEPPHARTFLGSVDRVDHVGRLSALVNTALLLDLDGPEKPLRLRRVAHHASPSSSRRTSESIVPAAPTINRTRRLWGF